MIDINKVSPEIIFNELRKTVISQDEYLRVLSNAAYLHCLRYKHACQTGTFLKSPKQNILCYGPSGSGKSLAARALGELLSLPVLIEDASALRGAGWKGTNVTSIVARAAEAAESDIQARFSIVVLDEIDKVFKSRVEENSFLPLDNLLSLLQGEVITHTPTNAPPVTMDTGCFLIICCGAFDGLDKIIEKRLNGDSRIGFSGKEKQKIPEKDLLAYVTDDDLRAYGISDEVSGRLLTVTRTESLTVESYKQILSLSSAGPIRQFDTLMATIGAHINITDAAVLCIAEQAEQHKTGARMLNRTVAHVLQLAIYEIGGDESITAATIDVNDDDGSLYVRYTYGVRPGNERRGQGDIYKLSDIEHDILDSVPFSCMRRRGDILLLASAIHKSYRHINALPENLSATANLILVTAICSHLIATRDEKTSFIHLYKEIDIMTNDTQARSVTEDSMYYRQKLLEEIRVEFIQKACSHTPSDDDFANAKKIAKCMLSDYCKAYLARLETGE